MWNSWVHRTWNTQISSKIDVLKKKKKKTKIRDIKSIFIKISFLFKEWCLDVRNEMWHFFSGSDLLPHPDRKAAVPPPLPEVGSSGEQVLLDQLQYPRIGEYRLKYHRPFKIHAQIRPRQKTWYWVLPGSSGISEE